jgi:hypothetical protein
MQTAEIITGTSVVDDVVTRFPATARVFIGRRMHWSAVRSRASRRSTVPPRSTDKRWILCWPICATRPARRTEPLLIALAQRRFA